MFHLCVHSVYRTHKHTQTLHIITNRKFAKGWISWFLALDIPRAYKRIKLNCVASIHQSILYLRKATAYWWFAYPHSIPHTTRQSPLPPIHAFEIILWTIDVNHFGLRYSLVTHIKYMHVYVSQHCVQQKLTSCLDWIQVRCLKRLYTANLGCNRVWVNPFIRMENNRI